MGNHIVDKHVGDLDAEEFNQCYSLNLGHGGSMKRTLMDYWSYHPRRARAVMLVNDEGEILSWALYFGEVAGDKRRTTYIYTPKQHRRNGYAATVIQYLRNRYSYTMVVCPWNKPSSRFFESFNLTCAPGYYYV